MNAQVSALDETGHLQHYASIAAFLATLNPADLTTALAAVLKLDRHELTSAIMVLRAETLEEKN